MGKLKHTHWPESDIELDADKWLPECCGAGRSMLECVSVIEWLYENVPETEENVRWYWDYGCGFVPYLRFRDSKYQILFMLMWS